MELEVTYSQREITGRLAGKTGLPAENWAEVLAIIEKYGTMIKKVRISGKSQSFTFLRQIYLFANLLSALGAAEVTINGRRIGKKVLLPAYQASKFFRNEKKISQV